MSGLSFAQQRIWAASHLDDRFPLQVVTHLAYLREPIERASLTASLRMVLDRHPLLRARFPLVADGSTCQLAPELEFALSETDLACSADRGNEFRALFQTRARQVELSNGPLFDFHLVRLTRRTSVLIASLHHIIIDRRSMVILAEDLSEAYAAIGLRREPRFQPLGGSYGDYVASEEAFAADSSWQAASSYWHSELAHLRRREREAVDAMGLAGTTLSFGVSRSMTHDMTVLATRARARPVAVWLALLGRVLSAPDATTDVIVGLVVSTRPPAMDRVLGCFINLLPIRLTVGPSDTVEDLVGQAHRKLTLALRHRRFPFQALLGSVLPRAPRGSPALDATLNYWSGGGRPERDRFRFHRGPTGTFATGAALFRLCLDVSREAGRARAAFEYQVSAFRRRDVRVLVGRIRELLRAAGRSPGPPDEG